MSNYPIQFNTICVDCRHSMTHPLNKFSFVCRVYVEPVYSEPRTCREVREMMGETECPLFESREEI